MVCDSHLAEDVTQGVFVALAHNVRQLTSANKLSDLAGQRTLTVECNQRMTARCCGSI
jgi:hypothetical protein